jgi:hypothetical protein
MLHFSMPPMVISLPYALWKLHSWTGIAVAVGALVIYAAGSMLLEKWRKHRTRGWPTVQGAVVDLKNTYEDGGANGVRYWRISFGYNYTVNGSDHSGHYKFNCVSEGAGKKAAERLNGATVNVHYNPRDAAKSMLWEDEVWDLWF